MYSSEPFYPIPVIPSFVPATWDNTKMSANLVLDSTKLITTQTNNIGTYAGVLSTKSFALRRVYFEIQITAFTNVNSNTMGFGDITWPLNIYLGNDHHTFGYVHATGQLLTGNVSPLTIQTAAVGNWTGFAIDCSSPTAAVVWIKNITTNSGWNNDILANQNPAVGSQVGGLDAGPYLTPNTAGPFFIAAESANISDSYTLNAGGSPYAIGTPPNGFFSV